MGTRSSGFDAAEKLACSPKPDLRVLERGLDHHSAGTATTTGWR